MERQVQIIYAPGTWGNTLRWMLDRFSKESKFHSIDSPWDKNGRTHGFKDEDFNNRFIRGHQLAGRFDSPVPNSFKIVMRFHPNDLVFVERCGFYRNPGYETDIKRHAQVIERADNNFVQQAFGDTSSKCVAKELYKIQFHDLKNHAWWNAMNLYIGNGDHYQFDLMSMFNETALVHELESISKILDLDLKIDDKVIINVVRKIRDSHVVKTKDRVKNVLDAIKAKEDVPCGDFDIIEQAFVETELEKINDCVLFPYGVNWFENTNGINDFLSTYPKYLKHMNPRLPWYNDIKNPFYLTGKIDKER